MTEFSDKDIVYCDANFLIAYGAKHVLQLELKKRAIFLFAKLLTNNCKIIASSLTFDETWLGIKKELGPKKIKNVFLFNLGNILAKVGLKLATPYAMEFSYHEIFDSLNTFTKEMLRHKNFFVVQFEDPKKGIISALNNLKEFGLKPRDSFHLALMKDNNASCFISNDVHHFCRNKEKIKTDLGISIESF